MKTAILTAVSAVIALGSSSVGRSDPPKTRPMQLAMTCMSTGEQVSGMNKICYYSCAGSAAAITVPSYKVCPVTIDR